MDFFDIPIVSIAISLIISWALFAILCSLVHELYAQVKAERGRFMKSYMYRQLQDMSNGINWAALLYMHGTIDLLSRAPNKPTNDILPKLFAETLPVVVGNSHIVQMQIAKGVNDASTNPYAHPVLKNFRAAVDILKPSDVVSFFKQALESAEVKATQTNAGKPEEDKVYRELVNYLENWYVEFGQRLSLWYKKKTRKYVFWIGLVLALIINVDSVELFAFYRDNPEARRNIESFYRTNEKTLSDTLTFKDTATINPLRRQLDTLISKNKIPVGIEYSVFQNKEPFPLGIPLKILGLIISGFAASFGAPFWFDVLRKAVRNPVK